MKIFSTISAVRDYSIFQYYTELFPWNMSATINDEANLRVRDYKNTGVSGSTPVLDTSEFQRPVLHKDRLS